MGGDPAGDKLSPGVQVTKETLYFQNKGIACIKAPKGMQGTSGVRINEKIITIVERKAGNGEKIEHNSAVKIEATKGRMCWEIYEEEKKCLKKSIYQSKK